MPQSSTSTRRSHTSLAGDTGRNVTSKAGFRNTSAPAVSSSLIKIIQQGRSTGRMNLSQQSLEKLPKALFDDLLVIGNNNSSRPVDISLDRSSADGPSWWDSTDLTRLIIADNQIEELDPRIGEFQALTCLDAHNNCLKEIPTTVLSLINLTHLNLSTNLLTTLPPAAFDLPLVDLNVSANKLTSLDGVQHAVRLAVLDASDNDLTGELPDISSCINLTKLNLSKNRLRSIARTRWSNLTKLNDMNLEGNELVSPLFSENIVSLPSLTRLDLKFNKLTHLDDCITSPSLLDLFISYNPCKSIISVLGHSPKLSTLEMRDCAFDALPDDVVKLGDLTRLDISNNSISQLPPSLGKLVKLNVLSLTGNPIRLGIPASSGTVKILRFLRDKIAVGAATEEEDGTEGASNMSSAIPIESKVCDLSNRSLATLPPALAAGQVDKAMEKLYLHQNRLTCVSLPTSLSRALTELILHHNQLSEFPAGEFTSLRVLDLSSNQISRMPNSGGMFPRLSALNLASNKIRVMPSAKVFDELAAVVLSGNQIEDVEIGFCHGLIHLDLR
ncbi:hypothetical protein SeLEV6574_g03584 [Synchytrium endobioticum]|uniref:Uncharacterized protein n=1 Tax=Synchytrium endobioticum TaxID=286115 RepID=A0A507D374_9FUNG|nr:hypothetical protein SeLEV6574_g03584 [Synchytrium endobioticum]